MILFLEFLDITSKRSLWAHYSSQWVKAFTDNINGYWHYIKPNTGP